MHAIKSAIAAVLLTICCPPASTAAPLETGSWTLERSITTALQQSPDAIIARRRIEAAQAALEQADSVFWPQLQLKTGYSRTNNPATSFFYILNQKSFSPALDFNNVPVTDNFNAAGQVSVPLFSGGRDSAGRSAALAALKVSEADAATVRSALALEVAVSFFSVAKTAEFIRASEASLSAWKNNLTIATSRLKAGTLLETEVLDLQVRQAQAEEDLIRAQNANALARRALLNSIGLELEDIQITEPDAAIAVPDDAAQPARPELESVRQSRQAAAAQIDQARSGYLPTLNAFSRVDYDQGWERDGSGTSYSGGILAEWTIFDGFRTRAQVRQAEAALHQTAEQERRLQLSISLEAERARLNLKAARDRLAVTQKALRLAQRSSELTRVRFNEGFALSTQLIDTESALTASQVRLAEARADERIATAALRKALGLPILASGETPS